MKNQILLPTYNEKENIEKIIQEIFKHQPDISVLVVDDNSPDGTAEAVKKLQAIFPNLGLLSREKKEGLGRAYIHAFREVLENPDVQNIIMMDADLSHDPKYLNEMISSLENGYQAAVGSRYVKGGGTEGWELWRRILSRFGNLYSKTITRMPVNDCTSGFIAINSEYLKKIDLESIGLSGYAFLIKLKYLLWRSGAKIKEVPILFKNRLGGESKISSHIISEGALTPWKIILGK